MHDNAQPQKTIFLTPYFYLISVYITYTWHDTRDIADLIFSNTETESRNSYRF